METNKMMDAPGRKVQRKRKMVPKQRKPGDSLDCLVEENLKVYIRSEKKPVPNSSKVIITEVQFPAPSKRSGTGPSTGPPGPTQFQRRNENVKFAKSKYSQIVKYKGQKMTMKEAIDRVVFEVIQRVVREVAEGIVNDMMEQIIGRAIDRMFHSYETKISRGEEPAQITFDEMLKLMDTPDDEYNAGLEAEKEALDKENTPCSLAE